MRHPSFFELSVFISVAKNRSFSGAATALRVSAATVSSTVGALEDKLGVRLLNRTTRSVALTEIGQRLFEHLGPVLNDYETSVSAIGDVLGKAVGNIRIYIAMPAVELLSAKIETFIKSNPDLSVQLYADIPPIEGLSDIVTNGFDAGIQVNYRIERSMVAVPVSESVHAMIYASPEYLARRPAPKTIDDLRKHNCLCYGNLDNTIQPWLLDDCGTPTKVAVRGSLTSNNGQIIGQAAMAGIGLCYGLAENVAPFVATGQLVPVMEEYSHSFGPFFLYYPSNRHVPSHFQALIDHLRV